MSYTHVDKDAAKLQIPSRAYDDDVGFDLAVSRHVVVNPNSFATVSTNLAVAMPASTWGLLVGRSSAFQQKRLVINVAVIDQGFRGEVVAMVFNPTKEKVVVQPGERLFRIIPVKFFPGVTALHRDELEPSDRGTRGAGSSGGYQE